MIAFKLNGYIWQVKFVNPDDPALVDRTDTLRVATTDPEYHTVYLSTELEGDFLMRVVIHEVCHCVLFSYRLLGLIHRFIRPSDWIRAEEWICNFVADYGFRIFKIARYIFVNK